MLNKKEMPDWTDTIKLNIDDYYRWNGSKTTWKCKYDWCMKENGKPHWVNQRCGTKKDFWGFCSDAGEDYKVEWLKDGKIIYPKLYEPI